MINSKYFRVPTKKEVLQENEVNVTSRQDPINFLRYAIFLFEKRNLPYVIFKASGSAISSLVNLAEILKKVIPGIHQRNRIYTLNYEQDYEPKEKGLEHVTIVRNVPILEISFYKVLPNFDLENHYGYQAALSPEIFDRVKINVNNLIRKHTQGNNEFGHSGRSHGQNGYNHHPQSTYKFGFRGKRGGAYSTVSRGHSNASYGSRGYNQDYRGSNRGSMSHAGSSVSHRGNKFGRYHSKFDQAEDYSQDY